MGLETRERIIDAATRLAEDIGYNKISYRGISHRTSLKDGSIQYYFPSLDVLKVVILRRSAADQNLKLIGQAIALEHEIVKEIPKQVINEAMKYLRGLNASE